MIEELHALLSLFALPGMSLGLGLCFFFLSIPKKESLRNYRTARQAMGFTYVIYAICLYLEYRTFSAGLYSPISVVITLIISCLHATLFTYACIILVNVHFLSWRRVLRDVLPIVVLSAIAMTIFFTCPESWSTAFNLFFTLYYIYLLISYVTMFRRHYRSCINRLDNYFSGDETKRLRWVHNSFYMATTVGVLAIIYAWFMSPLVSFIFMIMMLFFYTMFGIRFINYIFLFQHIEPVMEEEYEVSIPEETTYDEEEESELMKRIDDLVRSEELYKNADISIDDIALALSEKHYIISSTINRYRGVNFKAYINEYRVQEAAKLLLEDKDYRLTVDAVASAVGFSDRSNFYRVFKKHKGLSPSDFRKNG